ncbi:MAG: hypothetical protein V9G16_00700 [Nitrosomonas sp.]
MQMSALAAGCGVSGADWKPSQSIFSSRLESIRDDLAGLRLERVMLSEQQRGSARHRRGGCEALVECPFEGG